MIAKYATRCRRCPQPINPGDRLARAGGAADGYWVHAACHPGSEAEATTLPLPPSDGREVYTDGACLVNPGGPGGWAWALDAERHASGSAPATTNQRMEVTAAFEAVRTFAGRLVVVSDSRYVVDCFNKGWWRGWLKSGWLNSAKKPVANRDLWEPFVDLVAERGDDLAFRWVKGHAGHPLNELADQLAGAAARRIQAELEAG